MKINYLTFYILGVLILVLTGFFLFSKNACVDFLNILAGADNIYSNDVAPVKRKEISFNTSFVDDGRFVNLNDKWIAPTSFAELISTSSEIKKNIDFTIGNQKLFEKKEKDAVSQ
ncbi:MAG: hypothetical protein NT165_03815 [Candidatus Falkowbacteria bacterium]|nr:hypothetical protein [Candidatus Falkowbacteria bacterium]